MPHSGIRVVLDLAQQYPETIHLEIGQPDFRTPDHIIQAASQALWDGFTGYTPNAGLLSLREAIARKVTERNGIPARAENIVVTPGAIWGAAAAMMAVCDPGEEVLVPDPGWPNYEMMAIALSLVPVAYPLREEGGFRLDLAAIRQLITPRTKLLVVNSPANPTGSVLNRTEAEGLARLIAEHDLYLLSDEVYEDLLFEGEHISLASLEAEGRVISLFSFSKSYAMTGWRVAYVVASGPIAGIVAKMQEPFVACAPAVSQKAAEAALSGPQECVQKMCAAYRRRRNLALDLLRQHGLYRYTPQGAFYLMVDIRAAGMDSYTFATRLLEEEKVAVAPGRTFGLLGEPFVRISLANDECAIATGLERLCQFLKRQADETS